MGFDVETNAAVLIDAAGGEVAVPLVSKRELADRIWDRVAELRGAKERRTQPRRHGEHGASRRGSRVGDADETVRDLLEHARYLSELTSIGVPRAA